MQPDDLKEELIHSLQKYTEVDEPEPEAVPLIAGAPDRGNGIGDDDVADGPHDRGRAARRPAGPGSAGAEPDDDTEGPV